MDWFLYDRYLRHKRIKKTGKKTYDLNKSMIDNKKGSYGQPKNKSNTYGNY